MSYGWIDAKAYSINTLLLMDAWIVRYISHIENAEFNQRLSVILSANPAICWYFGNKCPDRKEYYEILARSSRGELTSDYVRECEINVLDALETFIVYLYPEIMDELPYIKTWDKKRLLSLADFTNKTVLDIGSGTGRLALAAAPLAKWVYACEPVDRLREYLREKLQRLQIQNVYVVDGTLEMLPFPNQSFDIVISGHVFGDDHRRELGFMNRVTRTGGYIIDCPGEEIQKQPNGPKREMLDLGFEYKHYESELGGDVYQYWKIKAGEDAV